MSNLTLYKNDEPRSEMDELLNEYFQAEMPSPWPAFKAPKAPRTRETPSLWSRFSGRIALAACVMLLIAGYWSLSGSLSEHQPTGLPRVGTAIGLKGKAPHVQDDQPLDPMGPHPRSK